MYNPLIFGLDPSEGIVNLTLKDDHMHIYSESLTGVISVEKFPYTPWVLTPARAKLRSEQLKGNQYYKWLTSITCEKFQDLQQNFQHGLWLPRSIDECFSLCEGTTLYKGRKVADISVLSFDIETSGLAMNATSKVYLISNTLRRNGVLTRKLFSVDEYPGQVEMIAAWCDWVRENDPSIMLGHNIFSYDFPYLNNIAPLLLGRDNSYVQFENKTSKFRKDGSQSYDYNNVRIVGREIIDTMFLSMKYDQMARKFPTYGLKPLIKFLGLEKANRTFIDASKITQYWGDLVMREKVKQYATEDSDDALKLFDLMIPPSFYLAQSLPMSLQQIVNTSTGGQINNFMIRSYLQDGHSIAKSDKITEHLEGGISFGVPGLYKNMLKLDLKSAYPSQILRFKLYDKNKDPNANFYKMVEHYTYERFELQDQHKKTKDQYFKDREQSGKVLINSAYGALSTNYLNYNSPALAAKITLETRNMIDMGLVWASGKDKDYWMQLFREKTHK
jgi:DNA polymerase elongation subunit (family B)